uniref:Uncharacterized protein n=1 Tax=Arundo donax TaxID=35708 RepID=A0A0A9FDH1_ARUDO
MNLIMSSCLDKKAYIVIYLIVPEKCFTTKLEDLSNR